jgi:DNA repair exonuclease SbcCD ATPase subunit
MTFLIGRIKTIKDLILAKLDMLLPRIEEMQPKLDEILQSNHTMEKQARSSAANETTLLNASIHLVETVQNAEHDRIEWQKQMLYQLNALYRQGMAQKEWQQQVSQKLEAVQQQIESLQQKIETLENRLNS